MTFEELLEKYQAVLLENGILKEEIENLNTKLGVSEHRAIPYGRSDNTSVDSLFSTLNTFTEASNHGSEGETLQSNVNGRSDPKVKVRLFMSLFKGRDDVYAKRWENKKKGTNGYSPFCLNEWKSKLCKKPQGKCTACSNKAYALLDEKVIDDHLRGRGNLVAGGISHRALNLLKRLAAFNNPEFYKAQAMRMPINKKKIPRIISCSDETEDYLCLPRGCETDLKAFFAELKIEPEFIDETNHGRSIDVEFKGSLRDEQPQALAKLLTQDIGVLSGTTAFGKTVVAIKLIAERKVNTLIIVDKVNLVTQWKKRLTEFLTINEALPDRVEDKKRGRKKENCTIGQLGAGKDKLSGIIDIAVMQSLNKMGEVKDCVKNYGMIIVDECHHISAVSFEKILKSSNAKYVYGLTATPIRKDGHHPIIFMQCGSIQFKDDAKKQAAKRPFEHYVIPRFTSLRVPLDKNEKDVSIQELYSEIVVNEFRNQLITDDVVRNFESGRNCLVLTERTAHVELLAKKLSERIPDVISLTGRMGVRQIREIMTRISETPDDKRLTLVATGKYIGEGFDEPRLDTLFLVMPISWKGTLQQYAGRLHKLFANKKEVQIYDYVDIHVRMLERMYHKRLNGYARLGITQKEKVVHQSQFM